MLLESRFTGITCRYVMDEETESQVFHPLVQDLPWPIVLKITSRSFTQCQVATVPVSADSMMPLPPWKKANTFSWYVSARDTTLSVILVASFLLNSSDGEFLNLGSTGGLGGSGVLFLEEDLSFHHTLKEVYDPNKKPLSTAAAAKVLLSL